MSSTPHPIPTKIGLYPVERELGRGGMGVVYLARDPNLGRQVAIKVLPVDFTQDPTRLQRFEREARTLAALSHRNVGAIFGLETDELGQRLLVLEFIPGVTLTSKLVRGGLPIDEAVRVCTQIAEGLEAAHELGITHRDLKPDNAKVTPDGTVKLLDFGLASAKPQTDAFGVDDISTASGSMLTVQGMVMGTPGYMSPEQARGQTTDRRTDVWAFGCVLFECLSGYKAFGGDTVTDIIAAILDREPDFTLLPARTPNRLRELIRRCLVKEARRRLRDIGDARIELEDVLLQPQSGWYRAAADPSARSRTVARLILPLHSAGTNSAPGAELSLTNSSRSSLAVSPDGAAVAFIAGVPPLSQLYVRRMDAPEARAIPGAANADAPFFSADGTKLGFFQAGKMMRISLTGGAPSPLAPSPRPQGASWDDSDFIYYIPDWQKGLAKIPGTGGPAEMVVQPDLAAGELAMLAPEVLPGSRYAALVAVWTGTSFDDAIINAIDLRTGDRRPLVQGGCNPRYVAGGGGHIVFSRGSQLLAVAFDSEKLEVFGHPMPVQDGVMGNALGGASQFAVGADGTLVYAPGAVSAPASALLAVTRTGETTEVTTEKHAFGAPAISPDGRRLAAEIQGSSTQIWLYDLEKQTPGGSPGVKVTFHADNACPVWSPDGKHIAFRSNMSGKPELYRVAVDAGGAASSPELLFGADDRIPTPCCSAELPGGGRVLLFSLTRAAPKSGTEVWMVSFDGAGAAGSLVVDSPTSAWGASVSPDGKLVAYISDETGRPEVYVQQFPGPGARRQVSADGGAAPLWARSGSELFFRAGDQLIAVRIAVEPSFMVGRPRPMTLGQFAVSTPASRNFDAFPDGQRFIVLRSQDTQPRMTQLSVVLNWFEELRRRVPVPERVSAAVTSGGTMMGSRHGGTLDGRTSYTAFPTAAGPRRTPASPTAPTVMPGGVGTPPPTPSGHTVNTQMPTIMPTRPVARPPAPPPPAAP